jgi:hypothetical protein
VNKAEDAKVTFFMIVTDYDAVVATYCIRAFRKLKAIPFRLVVYSNHVRRTNKELYFRSWRSYPFVDLMENDWQREDAVKPGTPFLEGPFEDSGSIWHRQLRRFQTPYVASVDADFEILNGRFVNTMLDRLDGTPNLIALSTDYSPTNEDYYDSYSGRHMRLHQRYHTWFIIYKRQALKCAVSLGLHRAETPGSEKMDLWDTTAWFQKHLREELGYELGALDKRFQNDFIHYGASAKNRIVNESNVALFRCALILRKRGFSGRGDLAGRWVGSLANRLLFSGDKRDRLHKGYSAHWPPGVDTYP